MTERGSGSGTSSFVGYPGLPSGIRSAEATLRVIRMAILSFDEVAPVLEAVGMAESRSEPFDIEQVSRDLGVSPKALRVACERAESVRLIVALSNEPETPAILTHAGRQYLALGGRVSEDSLLFLAEVIGDLHAREALLRAGGLLVDEFRHAILLGQAVDHAEELVPVAFRAAVDDRLAVDLFAASVALMARLSSGDAAGCLAEEIIAVALLSEARALLEMRQEEGELDAADVRAAKDALQELFDLFEDSDVQTMFEMEEPADAALARHSPISQQLGTADQRLEAWFHPFAFAAPTGHLSEQS
jgi:hypothetical protein